MKNLVATAVMLLLAGQAQAECQAVADNNFLVDEQNVTIKSITYTANNVFDLTDKHSFWLHEFANYTHTITKESEIGRAHV